VLKFWFSDDTEYFDRVTCAYEFFKELVRPENFPRGNNPLLSRLCFFSASVIRHKGFLFFLRLFFEILYLLIVLSEIGL